MIQMDGKRIIIDILIRNTIIKRIKMAISYYVY